MRKYIFIAFCALALFSCKKENPTLLEPSITGEATNVTPFFATVTCYANTTGFMRRIQRGVAYSTDPEMAESNSTRFFLPEGEGHTEYTMELFDLEPFTVYYYRSCLAYESVRGSSVIYEYGEIRSFETLPYDDVILEESPTAGVTSAILRARINFGKVRASDISKIWFAYSRFRSDVASGHSANLGAEMDGDGEVSCLMSDLNRDWKEYFYRPVADVNGKTYYGRIQSFLLIPFEPTRGEYIDMGLSVKWAPGNVGADNLSEYGSFFAWGETSTKESYSEAMYNYRENPDVLPYSVDVANIYMSSGWRMPTRSEYEELQENSLIEWGTYNDRPGCLCISTKNNNALFFPAAGYKLGLNHLEKDETGFYWTSTGPEPYSLIFYTTSPTFKVVNDRLRYTGGTVRGVRE